MASAAGDPGALKTVRPCLSRALLRSVVLALSIQLTIPEFFEMHTFDRESLRIRLGLPPGCEPRVLSAVLADAAAARLTVVIGCATTAAPAPPGLPARLAGYD